MHGNKPTHRHFIAAPVFVLFLCVSLAPFSGSLTASSGGVEAMPETVDLAEGVQAFLAEGSRLEDVCLTEGSMLVQGHGIVDIGAGSLNLTSLYGAFYVAVHGGTVSVAALTAPVLVSGADAGLVLVPAGLQWRGAGLTELPVSFRREQLARLGTFSTAPEAAFTFSQAVRAQIVSAVGFPVLPASRERYLSTRDNAVLAQAHALAHEGESEELRLLLTHPAHAELFASERGRVLLAQFLPVTAQHPPLASVILTTLLTDPNLWLVASMHPVLRTYAWPLQRPALDAERARLHLMMLPQSNMQGEPLSDVILKEWETDAVRLIDTAEDPLGVLEPLVEMLMQQYRSYSLRDYPQRAAQTLSALTHLGQRYAHWIPDHLSAAIAALKTESRLEIMREDDVEDAVGEPADPLPSLTPNELEERANVLLRDAGAVFTVQTSVDLLAPSTAAIGGIVFSTAQGDRMFAFHIDVLSGDVSHIVADGKTYPFRLPLTAFVEWLRKQ